MSTNSCCHHCRISRNRKRKKYVPYLGCSYCPNVYCYSCVVNHLHLNFEETLADPNWRCPPCREQCCCCRTECGLNHRHCFTYTRTKKRYEKARQWKMHQQISSIQDGRGGPPPMPESHPSQGVPLPNPGQGVGSSYNSPLLKRPRAHDQTNDDLSSVASPNKRPRIYDPIVPGRQQQQLHVPRRRGALPGIGSYGLLPSENAYVPDRFKSWDSPSPDLLNLMRSSAEITGNNTRFSSYIPPKPENPHGPDFSMMGHPQAKYGYSDPSMYSPVLPEVANHPQAHHYPTAESVLPLHNQPLHQPQLQNPGMHSQLRGHPHQRPPQHHPQSHQPHASHPPPHQTHQPHQPHQAHPPHPPQPHPTEQNALQSIEVLVQAPDKHDKQPQQPNQQQASQQQQQNTKPQQSGAVEATVIQRKRFNPLFKEEPEGTTNARNTERNKSQKPATQPEPERGSLELLNNNQYYNNEPKPTGQQH
mmetsp:Transcript_24212/g.26887  ORF Transcript_24212/g.26887 Transcript_24212/m.26887 type:complete len:474 (+) Transcript_24212:124-1545(+)